MIAQRALAVIAAALFVTAVAIATFGSESISLGHALTMFDDDVIRKLPLWSSHTFGNWVANAIVRPMLDRPAWLFPATLGLICAGLSLSLSNRKSTHRSHRRS